MTTVDEVLAQAREKTGLSAIDSESWREGLQIVLEEVDSPKVSAGGREIAIGRAVDSLANRLRVHAYVEEHPEVLEETIERPLFILGMPRTGTTVASYLLDQDPARRSLLNWEAVDSAPPPTTETLRTDPRCLTAIELQNSILDFFTSSGLGVPHWEAGDGPTECMFVFQQDFKGLLWDAFTPTDRYARWLLGEADMTSAYRYHKRVLQVLQSRAPGVWSLKMPSHAAHLDTLLEVFPDARLVWAHRDPFKATASLCMLQMTPAKMTLNPADIDKAFIGQNCKHQMREHVIRPLRTRERIGDERFFHLHYAELLRDPMGQMKALYDWGGDTFTPEVERRMRAWLEENPQHKHGVSSYSLAEYGLDKDGLAPLFEEYLAAFDIELEGDA